MSTDATTDATTPDQRFEYRLLDTGSFQHLGDDFEEAVAEGWRVVDTLDNDGTTDHLLLERPV